MTVFFNFLKLSFKNLNKIIIIKLNIKIFINLIIFKILNDLFKNFNFKNIIMIMISDI